MAAGRQLLSGAAKQGQRCRLTGRIGVQRKEARADTLASCCRTPWARRIVPRGAFARPVSSPVMRSFGSAAIVGGSHPLPQQKHPLHGSEIARNQPGEVYAAAHRVAAVVHPPPHRLVRPSAYVSFH